MYKKFEIVDERDKRIYMAGLSLTQLIGYRTVREFCANTVLAIGDVDTDDLLFFSNSIDRDVKNLEQDHLGSFSDYFVAAVDGYVKDQYRDEAHKFFSLEYLHDSFDSGLMSDSIEHECDVLGTTVWIRACYELEQNEEDDHLLATVVLIDITGLREK